MSKVKVVIMPARRSLFNGINSFDGDGEGG